MASAIFLDDIIFLVCTAETIQLLSLLRSSLVLIHGLPAALGLRQRKRAALLNGFPLVLT